MLRGVRVGRTPDGWDGARPPAELLRQMPRLVEEAAGLTRCLLAGDPERLRHSEGVARRAEFLTAAVDRDQVALLVAAAWLHDIGYAQSLQDSGFHPLDGARHLRWAGWPRAVCDLVAHHSGSRFVAAARGLSGELGDFSFQEDQLTDALTVADQTCGPNGRPMTVEERIEDVLARHGAHSPTARAHYLRGPYIRGAARRVATHLESRGIGAAEHLIFLPLTPEPAPTVGRLALAAPAGRVLVGPAQAKAGH